MEKRGFSAEGTRLVRRGFRDTALEEQYHREGYLRVPFLEPGELQAIRSLFDEAKSGCATGFYSTLWSGDIEYRRRVHEEVQRVLARPIGELLMDYRMCLANFAVKHPGQPDSKVPVHQDWTFVDESRYFAVAIWCPLVDVDSTNGCLAVVPRSHRITDKIRANHPNEVNYSPFCGIYGRLEQAYLRELPMRAGEAVIYNQGLLHGSKVNRSDSPRAAVVAAYLPREAQLRHYYQTSELSVDVYDVADDFYWKDVRLGLPPEGQRPAATVSVAARDVAEEEVAAMLPPDRAASVVDALLSSGVSQP